MMRVAIIGQGRSGRNIHGAFFRSEANDFCKVVCIVEEDDFRANRAREEFGCDVVSSYTQLFGREDIDLVVNASYSQMHYAITRDLLCHGFNVLCEKPFGRTYFECQNLINTAKANGVIVAAFHQTLFSPAFLKAKEIIASGCVGDVFQISLRYSGFARRWDWQTLQSKCAGSLYNSGPHPVGQALDFLGWDKDTRVAFSSLKSILTSGDSDDYAKVILTAPDKPVVDIEVNSVDGYAGDFVIKLCGSKGTYSSTNTDYKLKYIPDFSVYPERPVQTRFIENENREPAYCSEKLEFTEESGKIEGTAFDSAVLAFYKMMYAAVMEGQPLTVTPDMAAQVIRVIAQAHADNPLPVYFD